MIERENNNLYEFATKELSQDVFLCWLINWFNYKSKLVSFEEDEFKKWY